MFNKNSNNLQFLIPKSRTKRFTYNKNVIIKIKNRTGYNTSAERFNTCICNGYKVKYTVPFLHTLPKLHTVKGQKLKSLSRRPKTHI